VVVVLQEVDAHGVAASVAPLLDDLALSDDGSAQRDVSAQRPAMHKGDVRSTVSDDHGRFVFDGVAPGHYVLEGRAVHITGDELHPIGPDDLIHIPRGTVHGMRVLEGPYRFFSCKSPAGSGKRRHQLS